MVTAVYGYSGRGKTRLVQCILDATHLGPSLVISVKEDEYVWPEDSVVVSSCEAALKQRFNKYAAIVLDEVCAVSDWEANKEVLIKRIKESPACDFYWMSQYEADVERIFSRTVDMTIKLPNDGALIRAQFRSDLSMRGVFVLPQKSAEELYEDLRAIAEKFKISETRNENIVIWSSSGDEMSALSFHSVMAGFFQKIQGLCGIEPDVYSEIYSASFAKRCKR